MADSLQDSEQLPSPSAPGQGLPPWTEQDPPEQVSDPSSPTLSRHAKASDALAAIRGHKSKVAVLIDGDRHPVGYVTEDMVDGASGTIQDLARPLPATVPNRADLRAVVSEMFANDVMWLTCVDDMGRFVGVVTQPAVTSALGETYRQASDAAA